VLNLPLPLGSTVAVYQPLFEKKVMLFYLTFSRIC